MTLPIMTALPDETRGYIDGASGQIHYRSHGQGASVVLVHQAPWSSIQFRHVLPRLADEGFRAVAIDLPAHGMSDPPVRPGIQAYAEAIGDLITGLGLGPSVIIGHRGGALAAGHLAATKPQLVAGLVLDNAPLLNAEESAKRAGRFSDDQTIARDGAHFTDRWTWVRRVGDPDWSDSTVHIAVLTYFLHGPWKEHGHAAISEYDFASQVSKIACPTLVVASRTDPMFPYAAQLLARRPDWEAAELPGGPGMVLDRPAEWIVPVLRFLNHIRDSNSGLQRPHLI